MKVLVVKNQKDADRQGVKIFRQAYKHGARTFGLATGGTPEGLYRELCQSDLDFRDCIAINLDEYVGLDGNHPQSYRYYMQSNLFNQKPFAETYLPDGMAPSAKVECTHYNWIIATNPIDLQILGIGQNGHIGFNEPGTPFTSTTHVVNLTSSTIKANSRYFKDESQVPTQALTQGIGNILQAKQILLMAFGPEKAQAVKEALTGKVTEDLPASVLQKHPHVTVLLDEAAAALLPSEWVAEHVQHIY